MSYPISPVQHTLINKVVLRFVGVLPGGGPTLVVVCSQLPDYDNTPVTNIAEYLTVEVVGSAAKNHP
jgi:hypothetical protein